ncbi:GNAT family N-acetyltransferase [Alkalicaulis satelles]|nr:GNAT family N-acetyltransferase [Alkalicaulis satelles]
MSDRLNHHVLPHTAWFARGGGSNWHVMCETGRDPCGGRAMLHCETIRHDALGGEDRLAWINLARLSGLSSPLLHPDFACAVGRVREDVRFALYRDARGLAGVFAHHRRPGGFARPVGAAFSDVHAILTRPGLDVPASRLLQLAGLSRARFSAVHTGHDTPPDGMMSAGAAQACVLEGDPEALVERLRAAHPKRFKDLRRRLRRLEEDHGEIRLEAGADRSAFEQLITWKRAQYRQTGKHDVLAPRWAARLMTSLFDNRGGEVKGRLITFTAGGRLVAAEFGPEAQGCFHPWLAAYDPDMAGYSPGHLLVFQLVSQMGALGLTRYDMGPGHEDYKKYFANDLTPLHAGMARAPGLASSVRERAAGLVSSAASLGGERVSALAGRLHRRMDQIAAVETCARRRVMGITRAATQILASPGR